MLKRTLIKTALIFLTCTLPMMSSVADGARAVDVPAGDLGAALRTLAQQSGVEFFYRSEQVKGLHTGGVRGTLSAQEAVEKLLKGTQLTVKTDETGAILITLPTNRGADAAQVSGLLVAQADQAMQQVDGEADTNTGNAGSGDTSSKGVAEILVQGSRLLNMDLLRSRDDAQPYVIFDRQTIARSGATTIDEFLKTRLPMNAMGTTNGQAVSSTIGATSSINLRGLGTDQTLILIDGHRVADFSFGGSVTQADINHIPVTAIERIEVLPTTASSIYGGSATGGVVNVILRRDYRGAELQYNYGNTFDSDTATKRLDLAAGFALEGGKTTVLLNASYSDANFLLAGDRDFTTRGVEAIKVNNPTSTTLFLNPPVAATPNILSQNNTNLTLKAGGALNSPITFVPRGYAGITDGGVALIANAGRYNWQPANDTNASGAMYGDKASLLSAPRIESARATVRREFGSRLQGFLELSAANSTGRTALAGIVKTFTLSSTLAANPFNQNIIVSIPNAAADGLFENLNKDRRVMGGVIFKLPLGWKGEADVTWQTYELSSPGFNAARATYAAGVTNGTIGVIRDTELFPIDMAPHLAANSIRKAVGSEMNDYTLRAGGPLFSLPAGQAQLSALVERRNLDLDESRSESTSLNTYDYAPPFSQDITSVYLELRAPLLKGEQQSSPLLELQLSGRTDRYKSQNGSSIRLALGAPPPDLARGVNKVSSTNPTVALRYQPLRDVILRASFGTGFKPPGLSELVTTTAPQTSIVTDPRRGNGNVGPFTSLSGGNADLQPEKSKNLSAGVVLTPRFAPGWRLSIDYLRLEKEDNIAGATSGSFQGLVDAENLNPGRIIRGPNLPGDPVGYAGPIQIIDFRLLNGAKAILKAIDFQLDYTQQLSLGSLNVYALATRTLHYQTQQTALLPTIENVGVGRNFPLKWKANFGATLERAAWTVGWAASYFDSYLVSLTPLVIANQGNGGRVASQNYHDLFVGYRFPGVETRGWLSGVEVQAGVKNVFNTKPPFDAAFTGLYYSSFGDPRLANYYVSAKKAF